MGDHMPPTGSTSKLICLRIPSGSATTCSWFVLPKRVLTVTRPSGVQSAKNAPRVNW